MRALYNGNIIYCALSCERLQKLKLVVQLKRVTICQQISEIPLSLRRGINPDAIKTAAGKGDSAVWIADNQTPCDLAAAHVQRCTVIHIQFLD